MIGKYLLNIQGRRGLSLSNVEGRWFGKLLVSTGSTNSAAIY
jgi:hypothetical protein